MGNRTGRNGSSSSRDVGWFSTSSLVVCVLFTVVVNIVVGCVCLKSCVVQNTRPPKKKRQNTKKVSRTHVEFKDYGIFRPAEHNQYLKNTHDIK